MRWRCSSGVAHLALGLYIGLHIATMTFSAKPYSTCDLNDKKTNDSSCKALRIHGRNFSYVTSIQRFLGNTGSPVER
jgi:hypothetical protein